MDEEPSNLPETPQATSPNPPAKKADFPFVAESIDSVDKSTSNYLKRHGTHVIAVCIVTVALEITFALAGARDPRVYLAPLLLPVFGYSWIRSRVQHEFMEQFAAANGYLYSAKGTLVGLDGSLFKIGHSKSVTDFVTGKYENQPITLLSYTYVTGYGKSSQTHNYTVFELQFDIIMPDILLENGSHGFGESLFDNLSGKNMVKLEGDFNHYFSLSVPTGYELEALEIFTPDVMEELILKAKSLSLEIVNGHCFIYASKTVSTKTDLYALYELAQYFAEKLAPLLARMKSSVEAMEQYTAK